MALSFSLDLDRFMKEVYADLRRVEREAGEILRGLAVEAFKYVIYDTPQFSGHAASNWNFTRFDTFGTKVSYTMLEDYRDSQNFTPFVKGMGPATDIAIARNIGNDEGVEITDKIKITNSADKPHGDIGDSPDYLEEMEAGSLPLRSVNRPGMMMTRAVETLNAEYNYIAPEHERYLRRVRISSAIKGVPF